MERSGVLVDGAMLAACLREDGAAKVAFDGCHFIDLRVAASLANAFLELVAVFPAIPLRLLAALFGTVLLRIFA